MKRTLIIGTAFATAGLAACGSTVAPAISPTLALSVAPTASTAQTVTATPAPPTLVLTETCDSTATAGYAGTVSFSGGIAGYMFSVYGPGPTPFNYNSRVTTDAHGDGTLTPVASPPPSPGSAVGTYEYAYAPDGASSTILGSFAIVACPPTSYSVTTTCAVPGSAQGGSVVITFADVRPDTVVIDGNTVDVTSNPFTYGPLTVGDHRMTIEGFDWPLTIAACVPTPQLTIIANCAPGRVAWTGTETGDKLFIGVGAFAITLQTGTSGTYGPLPAGTYDTEFSDTSDNLIGGVTTITIGVCPKPTPKPSASSEPGTGARLG